MGQSWTGVEMGWNWCGRLEMGTSQRETSKVRSTLLSRIVMTKCLDFDSLHLKIQIIIDRLSTAWPFFIRPIYHYLTNCPQWLKICEFLSQALEFNFRMFFILHYHVISRRWNIITNLVVWPLFYIYSGISKEISVDAAKSVKDIDEEKRKRLREVEVKVAKYADKLESSGKENSASIKQKVEQYRQQLLDVSYFWCYGIIRYRTCTQRATFYHWQRRGYGFSVLLIVLF